MKRHILSILSATICILSAVSCTNELEARIEELREDVSEVESRLAKYSSELSSLSSLVKALEQNDHIKSISSWMDDGYRIAFTSGASIFLYQGKQGVSPIVGVQYNETLGNYYWTIQMGPNGTPTWMTNSYGVRVRATGVVPRLKIEGGVWWYTFDGSNWTKCNWGDAQGHSGSSVFSNVETDPDGYYVKFTLASGTVFQIPTQKGFDELSSMCDKINRQFDTYTKMVNDLDSSVFVRNVAEIQEDGKTVGYSVTLGDGSSFEIRNGKDCSFSTQISARRDSDGKYYWVYRNDSSGPYQWMLYKGEKIPVSPEDVTPQIGIVDSLGVMYFTVSYMGGEPEFMLDADGNPVQANGRAGISYFKSAEIHDSYLKLETSDGEIIRLPTTRALYPSLNLTSTITAVSAGTEYTDVLQARIVDTLQMMPYMIDYNAYMAGTGSKITAVALDGGYAMDVVPVSFSTNKVVVGTEYIIVVNIPFKTSEAAGWDSSRKTRIAVFLTWGTNTQMRVATFDNL